MLLGFTHGMAVSAAAVVLITVLGIAPQLAAITGTKRFINVYGYSLCAGAVLFSMAELLEWRFSLKPSSWVLAVCMTLWGIFTGVFLSALAEVFNIFPALTSKLGLKQTIYAIIIALAAGKVCGAVISLITPYF